MINFLGGKALVQLLVPKKLVFSYKRGCKCVNISLMVQKKLQDCHLKGYSRIFSIPKGTFKSNRPFGTYIVPTKVAKTTKILSIIQLVS